MPTEFTMNDTARELEARIRANRLYDFPVDWADELVFPYYGGLSLWNVAQTTARMLGIKLPGDAPLDEAVWGGQMPSEIERVVLILTDGLGYLLLKRFMAEDETVAEAVSGLTDGRGPLPITSILPSTTATALPTLWTGRTPAAHAMLGTTVYLREFSMLGDLLGYRPAVGRHGENAFESWGLPPEEFISVSGMSELLADAGIPTHLVISLYLKGGGLSRILHRGVQHVHLHHGYSDVGLRLRETLRETAGKHCCVSVYLPNIDGLSHMYGADTPYVRAEIKQQMTMFRDILADRSVKDGHTLVMILTDHGHCNAPQVINLVEDDRLEPVRAVTRCRVGGEQRFPYVYVSDGQRQTVTDIVTGEFPNSVTTIEGQAAIEAGLFGPETPHPEIAHRAGDVILVPRLGWRVVEVPHVPDVVSTHGGLSDQEMLVPLLWKRI